MLRLLFTGVAAGFLSWALTPVTMRLARAVDAFDRPGPRKIHSAPVPRLGGLAVVGATLVVWATLWATPALQPHMPADLWPAILCGLLPILLVSMIDDIRGSPPILRLLVHFAAATVVVLLGVRLGPTVRFFDQTVYLGLWAYPISILWIAGVTNAFNLVDGLDGLSAGFALISAISLAAVGVIAGGLPVALPAIALVGALLGFLPFNVYPARVFLGDAGATCIGFCLACLGLRGGAALSSGMAILVPALATGVPLADAALSIVRRTVRRVYTGTGNPLQGDCDHIHHRLLGMGISHQRAVFVLYGISAAVALVALLSMLTTSTNAALLFMSVLIAAFVGIARLRYDEFAVIRKGVFLAIYDAPVLRLSIFPVFFDLCLVALALYVATAVKYDDWSLTAHRRVLELWPVLSIVTVATFSICRLYDGSWRHANLADLVRATGGVITSTALAYVACRLFVDSSAKAGLFIIFCVVQLVLINGARCSFRILSYWRQCDTATGDDVLIYGAGAAGALALRELLSNQAYSLKPVGFIDDDPRKAGKLLNGYPIVGSLCTLRKTLMAGGVKGIVVASAAINPETVAAARSICDEFGVSIMRFRIALIEFSRTPQPPRPPDVPARNVAAVV